MIKLGIRRNLFYPSMLITSTFFRQIDSLIMKKTFKNEDLVLTLIMFFSEFIFGLILYKRNINFLLNKGNNKNDNKKIKLIYGYHKAMSRIDSRSKIYVYIILIAFFDLAEFIVKLKNYDISPSLDTRLRSIVTISSAIFSYFLLKIPIYKHHKFSLLIIIICLIIIIILEYIIDPKDNLFQLTKGLLFIFPGHIFNSFKDIIEKYILEYNYVNPFQTLMIEGAFGSIFTILLFFFERKTLNELKKKYDIGKGSLSLLIICLIFYFLFSGGKNIYRILTNKLYSPITKSLADSILDPLLLISFFCFENDFKNNFGILAINIILSLILVLSACFYNELFVLFCWKLEENTYLEVSERASRINELNEMINDGDDSSDDEDNGKTNN